MTGKTKLISRGPGHYESEDGRVLITLDETFETECDGPHPVKENLARIRSRFVTSLNGEDAFKRYIAELKGPYYGGRTFLKNTKKDGWQEYIGYQCPGHETHYYSQWTVQIDGEWTEDVYDSFTLARAVAEQVVGPMTLVRQRREQPAAEETVEERSAFRTFPTTVDPVTGAATWVACGHRAERDINDQCYTCHGDLAAA